MSFNSYAIDLWQHTKSLEFSPVFELPLVVVELDSPRVLHPAHDVHHVVLGYDHLGAERR